VPALLLLAVALGLDNLAAAIGFGASATGRISGGTRVRIAVVFGLFEAGMPVLGLLLGHGLADGIGEAARWLGGAALIAFGVAGLVQARRDSGERVPPPPPPTQRSGTQPIGRLLLIVVGAVIAAGVL
jgi:manganese efflux pump family protein